MYATESENKDAKLFNCVQVIDWLEMLLINLWMKFCCDNNIFLYLDLVVQRGHQNSLELMPIFFLLMILGGISHPCICAALGSFYIVTRIFYFNGYATGDPQKRLTIGFVSLFLYSITLLLLNNLFRCIIIYEFFSFFVLFCTLLF